MKIVSIKDYGSGSRRNAANNIPFGSKRLFDVKLFDKHKGEAIPAYFSELEEGDANMFHRELNHWKVKKWSFDYDISDPFNPSEPYGLYVNKLKDPDSGGKVYAIEREDKNLPYGEKIMAFAGTCGDLGDSRYLSISTLQTNPKYRKKTGAGEAAVYGVVKSAPANYEGILITGANSRSNNFYKHIGLKPARLRKCELEKWELLREDFDDFTRQVELKQENKWLNPKKMSIIQRIISWFRVGG